MYLDKCVPARSLIGNLFLHRIEHRTAILVLAADNLVRMILHAENQPCVRHAFQIGFVAQCREVLSQLLISEPIGRFLKLHHLRFRR